MWNSDPLELLKFISESQELVLNCLCSYFVTTPILLEIHKGEIKTKETKTRYLAISFAWFIFLFSDVKFCISIYSSEKDHIIRMKPVQHFV